MKINLQRLKYLTFTSLLVSCISLAGTEIAITDAIQDTIEEFYYAVSADQCDKAIKIRLKYKIDSCKKIDKVYLHQVEVKAYNTKNAVVMIETDIESHKRNRYFKGYLQLEKIQNNWYIIGPYKNMQDFDLDTYIKEFLPKDFFNDNKKSLSKSVSGQHQSKALPPGDVIDSPPLQEASVDNGNSRVSALTAQPAGFSKQDREIMSYLRGDIAVEGKLSLLLKNIDDLFPEQSSNLILIDQSQGLLYLYNQNRELIGYYPVLTTPISHFPKGLYRIHQEEVDNNTGETTKPPADKQSLTMEKMDFDTNHEVLISGYYYLRDFFDADQKNSLALSPLDIIRLHQSIKTESLVYIGR